ncbi:MAG: TRAP transporter substrate-binding protein [Candidatus Rokubacteria bacterium]|nr:TRAP transporter substrate-binding protein [Candidatus Rokubacteria bacterium]
MRTRLVACAVLGLVAIAGGVQAAAAQSQSAATTQLRIVATSRPQVQFKLWEWLAAELDKRTQGRVKAEAVSLPELGLTGFELVRVTRAGLVDIADVVPGLVSGDVPIIEGIDLPGLFKDFAISEKAHLGWHEVLKKQEDKLGAVFLGSYGWATQVLYSRKPIRDVKDLKGVKARVFGTAQAEFLRALGAEPVSIAVAEVYGALERGTVDAAITGTIAGYNLKWFEVTKYLVDLQMGPAMGMLLVSKRTWDRLAPDVRRLLQELGPEFTRRGWDMARQTSQEGIDRNREKGMEWIPATPAMAGALRDATMNHVAPSWAKRAGPDARSIFNQYLAPHAGFTLP